MAVYLIEDNSHDKIKPELQRILRQYNKVRNKYNSYDYGSYPGIEKKLIKQWRALGMSGSPNQEAIDKIGTGTSKDKEIKAKINILKSLIPECQRMIYDLEVSHKREGIKLMGFKKTMYPNTFIVRSQEFSCYDESYVNHEDRTWIHIDSDGTFKIKSPKNYPGELPDMSEDFEEFRRAFYQWLASGEGEEK